QPVLSLDPPPLFAEPPSPLFELCLPLPVGTFLELALFLFRGELLGSRPPAPLELISQPTPGGLAFGIEPDHLHEVCFCSLTQAVLLAPERELPVTVGVVRRAIAPNPVLSLSGQL